MTSTQDSNRLHTQLAQMIVNETVIEQRLEKLIPAVSDHTEVTALLIGLQSLCKSHRRSLETRLSAISNKAPSDQEAEANPISPIANVLGERGNYPVSTSLQVIYTMLHQAVIGYSVLHPIATRFLDSPYSSSEGTAYHLTRQHTFDYVQAIQQISRLLHDVVLWELDQTGLECQCVCPSCGVGICVCSLAGRSFLRNTWAEVGPIADSTGVYVQLPKQNSAAAKAGLRRGDVVIAVAGHELGSYGDLQSGVQNVEPGKEVHLTIRRGTDAPEVVVVKRPST
jgi:hypothetical protein